MIHQKVGMQATDQDVAQAAMCSERIAVYCNLYMTGCSSMWRLRVDWSAMLLHINEFKGLLQTLTL